MPDNPANLANMLQYRFMQPQEPKSKARQIAEYLVNDSPFAEIAKSAYSGLTFPGEVYRGEASPYDMPRVMDLAGLATMAPSVFPSSGELRAGLAAFKGGKSLNLIPTFGDLVNALPEDSPAYVRWSRGPEFDLAPGAASKDYVSGEMHPGLSAMELEKGMSDGQLFRYLRDYSFLRMKDKEIRPHIYSGERVGFDSDSAPSITPRAYIGTLSDDVVNFLDNDNALKAIELMNSIANTHKALEADKIVKPKWIMPYSQDTLNNDIGQLKSIGGPLYSPIIRGSDEFNNLWLAGLGA